MCLLLVVTFDIPCVEDEIEPAVISNHFKHSLSPNQPERRTQTAMNKYSYIIAFYIIGYSMKKNAFIFYNQLIYTLSFDNIIFRYWIP
jgi:hypothetical protein